MLGAVPVLAALLVGALMLPVPGGAQPDDVPLPMVSRAALDATERADDDAAERAAKEPLSQRVRAAGEAIRAFNTAEAREDPDAPWTDLRSSLDRAVSDALGTDGVDAMRALRSVQVSRFVGEVRRFEQTGETSAELDALAGGFFRRMADVGWVDGKRVLMNEDALRAAFKVKWNVTAKLDARAPFDLTLDENRALYAFYLSHPHAPENVRRAIDAARQSARKREDCAALDEGERMAIEQWRADKVDKLAKLDPEYPTAYALGVAQFRAGRYDLAQKSLSRWLDEHPDGAYALRARNYLVALRPLVEH